MFTSIFIIYNAQLLSSAKIFSFNNGTHFFVHSVHVNYVCKYTHNDQFQPYHICNYGDCYRLRSHNGLWKDQWSNCFLTTVHCKFPSNTDNQCFTVLHYYTINVSHLLLAVFGIFIFDPQCTFLETNDGRRTKYSLNFRPQVPLIQFYVY